MSDDCLFCKIIAGDIPSEKLYEDDIAFAFKDINPAAPHHFLVIPKKHIPTLNDISDEDLKIIGHLMKAASEVCKKLGVADKGYRIISNVNKDAGQEVFHVHFHVLAGLKMGWSPV